MPDAKSLDFFAITPKGLELLLVDELRSLGVEKAAEKLAGVSFTGTLATAYKACLWSRLANRILWPLKKLPAATPEALYLGVQSIEWDEHIEQDGTFAIQCVCSQSTINHSLFASQKVKDAIVDQFRSRYNIRPSVARIQPQVSLHVYIHKNEATISIDLSGESLHRRGYRLAGGAAPLKENLAAAILMRAGWKKIAEQGGTLVDPLCGSGTLLIEGAMLAANIAPGLRRSYFGFLGWKKHEPNLWQMLKKDAQERADALSSLPMILGFDSDKRAIKSAHENIARAGLQGRIHVEKRELSSLSLAKHYKTGLLITNPPYGERIGEISKIQPLYSCLGDKLKESFQGWQAVILTGNQELGKQMGLRARRYYSLFNGALPCKLLLFDVQPEYFVDRSPQGDNERLIRKAKRAVKGQDSQGVQMFVNRLHKKLKHLKRQAKRQALTEFRIYDADLPDYAFAIDLSEDSAFVREYKAPKSIDKNKVLRRRQEVLSVLPELLNLPPQQIFFTIIEPSR